MQEERQAAIPEHVRERWRELEERRPDGERGVEILGHRDFIGGAGDMWEAIGKLQFDFLLAQGLLPRHVFIDVACGSLRAGRLLIPYLDEGNYLGIDKLRPLIDAGIEHEVGADLVAEKKPSFVVSDRFGFDQFDPSRRPQFGIAQSLFTHLTSDDIALCLTNLADFAAPGMRFFATYFERTAEDQYNPPHSHSHHIFRYTAEELCELGRGAGWEFRDIGGWNHPRDQKIVCFQMPE